MITALLSLLGVLGLGGTLGVLYYRSRALVLTAQLAQATSAAAGAAERAQSLAGALDALKTKTDHDAAQDLKDGATASGNPVSAGRFLRDSVVVPGVLTGPGAGVPHPGGVPVAFRAHAPRFVAGFGRR